MAQKVLQAGLPYPKAVDATALSERINRFARQIT